MFVNPAPCAPEDSTMIVPPLLREIDQTNDDACTSKYLHLLGDPSFVHRPAPKHLNIIAQPPATFHQS